MALSVYALGRLMLVVTSALYILFNLYSALFNPIPRFIFLENLAYAAIFLAAALRYDSNGVRMAAALIAAFSAGRVSRSVVTAVGTLGSLAIPHLPLLAWLVALSIVLALASIRR